MPFTENGDADDAPIPRRNKVQDATDAAHNSAFVRTLERTT